MKTKPQRVTWTTDSELQCAILGALGFSTKFIMAETGLTQCQVSYRLGKGRIKRADYRNGESDMAEMVLRRAVPPNTQIKSILNLKAS